MAKAPSWKEIERAYFCTPGKEEFHGYLVMGVLEHWDHRLVQIKQKYYTEHSAHQYLDDLQGRIDKTASRWPKFWWRQFTMRAFLKVYRVDSVVAIQERSKWEISRSQKERKDARRTGKYLLVLSIAVIVYVVYRMLLQSGVL